MATDGGGISSTFNFELRILDENDNIPEFQTRVLVGYINEGVAGFISEVTVTIFDRDIGRVRTVGIFEYEIRVFPQKFKKKKFFS